MRMRCEAPKDGLLSVNQASNTIVVQDASMPLLSFMCSGLACISLSLSLCVCVCVCVLIGANNQTLACTCVHMCTWLHVAEVDPAGQVGRREHTWS